MRAVIAVFVFLLPLFSFAEEKLDRPLLNFHSVPAQPKIGQRVSIFAQLDGGGFEREEVVLSATIDGHHTNLEKSSEEGFLWVADLKEFTEVRSHQLSVDIGLRNKKISANLKESLRTLNQAIKDLNSAIELENDLDKKAALILARDEKIKFRDQTRAELDALVVFLKTETFNFQIESDPNNTSFPQITGVSPNAVITGRRTNVVIAGLNFGTDPTVKIGGLNASVQSSSATQINVLAPNFSESAVQNIEVKFAADGGTPKKNAILSDSFFSTDVAILKNLRPVAVTPGYFSVQLTNPVQLSSNNSHDENEDEVEYVWEFVASPSGSVFTPGTTLSNTASPSFTPDKKGIFRVKLRLHEVSTTQGFYSYPSITTIEVK